MRSDKAIGDSKGCGGRYIEEHDSAQSLDPFRRNPKVKLMMEIFSALSNVPVEEKGAMDCCLTDSPPFLSYDLTFTLSNYRH